MVALGHGKDERVFCILCVYAALDLEMGWNMLHSIINGLAQRMPDVSAAVARKELMERVPDQLRPRK